MTMEMIISWSLLVVSAARLVFVAVFRRSPISPRPLWSFLVSLCSLSCHPSVAAVCSSPFLLVPPKSVDLSVSELCSFVKRVLPGRSEQASSVSIVISFRIQIVHSLWLLVWRCGLVEQLSALTRSSVVLQSLVFVIGN